VIRLHPNDDLKVSLQRYAHENLIRAGCVVTCVGSLNGVTVRVSDGKTIKKFEGQYEIVSLVGTIEKGDMHMHISFSDHEGNVFGGHLKEGCKVYTTVEVVLDELSGFVFNREYDEATGYDELKITKTE